MADDALKQIAQNAYDQGWTTAQSQVTFQHGFDAAAKKQAMHAYPDDEQARRVYQWAYKVGMMSYFTGCLDHFDGTRDLSIILLVSHYEKSINTLIQELQRLKPKEIIVMMDGTTPAKTKIADHFGCKIMQVEQKLGHHVGHGLGAFMAEGSTLLILDTHCLIQAEQLLPFVMAIEIDRADLALNHIHQTRLDQVSTMRNVLNLVLKRPDLGASSMTAFPYAIKRSLLHELPKGFLLTPPKAYAHIVSHGDRVTLANSVDVSCNKTKTTDHLIQKHVEEHLDVIAGLQEQEPAAPKRARVIVSDDPLDTFAAEAIYQGGEALVEKALPPSTALLHLSIADLIQEGLKHVADALTPLHNPQEVARLVVEAAEQKRGFSLIRLGESELLTLAHGTVLSEAKVQAVGQYILPAAGISIPNQSTQDELLHAIQHADLIGIPTHRGPTMQGLLHKLVKYYGLPIENMSFTTSGIHNELQQVEGFYRQLCTNRRILLIGNKMMEWRTELEHQGYTIVGEIPVAGVTAIEHVIDQAWCYEFDVSFVSAGVAGAMICQKIGQMGKVALDIGHL